MKVRWIIIAVAIIIISLFASIAVFAGNENNEEVSVEEATSLLNQAVAYAQARHFDKLCELAGSKGICRHQWELAGGEQAVPAEPPEIVDTYLLPTVYLKNGYEAVGGRVLVVEGVDGLGKPYRTGFFVFRSIDSGLGGLVVTNVVYWSGYGIAQVNEDGSMTTGHPNPRPDVE
ncbi:MAG TPA: hypothetical protein VIH69_00285 [Dehalococcoidia bacterium]